jgi:hypothetical protein
MGRLRPQRWLRSPGSKRAEIRTVLAGNGYLDGLCVAPNEMA